MVKLFCVLLSISLAFSQSVEVAIPGQRQEKPAQGGGGGGTSVGVVLGALFGGLVLSLVLSKLATAKLPEQRAPKDRRMPPFVPFEFIVVYSGSLPIDLEIVETESFQDINFSLVRWEKSQKELEDTLSGSVLFVQPNYLYTVLGQLWAGADGTPTTSTKGMGELCLLDTGIDLSLPSISKALALSKNHLKSPYKPEDHGTASAHLVATKGARLFSHRVCQEGRCTSMAIAKALVDCYREGVKTISTPFGMYGEDRLVSLIISGLSRANYRLVAPVGNEPSYELPFPARHPSVIKVAGEPCFPFGVCEKFPREPYRVSSVGVGGKEGFFVGTSFSSVLHAVKLALEP